MLKYQVGQEVTKRITLHLEKQDGREVTARFATLGVVDHDGDIIEPGAIGDQNVLMGAYNHDFAMLPPGKGYTYETSTAAMFQGEFFDTFSGNEHYTTIKAAGDQMDWSFRFFVEEGGFEVRDEEENFVMRKLRVTHVAPVESGAGIDTMTTSIKSCGPECQAAKGAALETSTVQIDYEKLATAIATALKGYWHQI